ncbi:MULTISPECIES: SGNH/GDSL hydrolase family protein [unclassified Flavobacterium]|uniref:SGNH/GDSL hydrolase family protein n=1 Tax=unclassified Flavobacterium TaxID=196869 RepID=UPI000EB586CD|nr:MULTISPECIES: SGNH/GDSL hydrolase family protein [unclassified Flavobacterium]RKS01278.1 GDSL-like lipase/acylhydrolase family protein [Flavobacterium sp. 102]
MIKNFKWLLLVSLTFVACNSDDEFVADPNSTDGTPLTAGTADFSKYVALGDSFAAGFSDNALFMEGQKNSYPNIIASQFALVGGGEFTNPFMNDNIGGFSSGGAQISAYGPRLWFNAVTSSPLPVSGVSSTDISTHLSGSFNNMGIPGAKSFHLTFSGYGSVAGNPYFARFASSPTATVLEDALAQDPTFFSLWIGGNDVLGYATSGGVNPADITAPATFNAVYNSIVGQLVAGGRKGVVANLPYVSTLPYFTTVPHNPVPLNATSAAQLNAGFATYNNGLLFAQSNGLLTAAEVAQRTISFSASSTNRVVIVDEYLTNLTGFGIPSYRQATNEDLIVLPARAFIGSLVGGNPAQINGVSVPLADQWVLSKSEILEVKTATDAYNQTIQSAATANGLAFVDAKVVMDQLSTTGIVANNYTLTSAYVTGATFSLDGVHPSPRGYAYIANIFLKAINTTYGSNFKGVDVGTYRILYPQDPANF